MAELKKCPACGSEKGAPSFSGRAWGRKTGRCLECVQNKIEIPPRTISSLRVRTREAAPSEDAAHDVAAGAADAAFGRTALSAELLRVAGKVHGNMKGDPVGGLMTYCGENSLNSVNDVVAHYPEAADRVRETICDAEMAFSSLVVALTRIYKLRPLISNINAELFEKVSGARSEEVATKTHSELLALLRLVCARHKAEEKDRNLSEYEKALETLKGAEELDSVVKAQLKARGELYKATGVLGSCVNVKTFNDEFLETSFDKTLHLPAGGLDLSSGDYTPNLAAEPGAASRLALSKFARVPTRRPQLSQT